MEAAAETYLDYARTDFELFMANEEKFEQLIKTADDLGYGVQDGLQYMYDDACAEVYGEEDEDV